MNRVKREPIEGTITAKMPHIQIGSIVTIAHDLFSDGVYSMKVIDIEPEMYGYRTIKLREVR